MALEKAPYWTDLYYDVVAHYFWRPQDIGRKSDPEKQPRHWNYWREKLESQEAPLNHILNFLFHIAPQELLDRLISALLHRQMADLQLVAPAAGTIDHNIVQPDIILSNTSSLIFVEMKVDSRSSIDQFAKYGIAAHWIMQDEPQMTSVDLIMLGRHTDHCRIWKNAKRLGLTNEQSVRKAAIRGLEQDPTIWRERGVQRYIKAHPEEIPKLAKRLQTMGLHLADYAVLEGVLSDYANKESTVQRLVQGVLQEFTRRRLGTR